MWYFCEFYSMLSPSLFCIVKCVICISCPGVILPLHLNYICVFIDMFVRLINVSVLLCLCMLYNIIFGYNSPWFFFYISPMHGLFHYCVIFTSVFVLIFLWMLYLWLLPYVCVLRMICSLLVIHMGDLVIHISCVLFIIPLSSSLLTRIHKIRRTYRCFN